MIPYMWQEKVIAEAAEHPKRAMFVAPRCGKTFAACEMLPEGRSLIVAPLSVCGAWKAELEATRPFSVTSGYNVPMSSLNLVLGQSRPQSGALVLNVDKMAPLTLALRAWRPDNIVFDESHLLKGHQTARSKAARKLAKGASFVRILTGTPAPNHYGDLWAQMVLVNPERWGTWTWFKNRFLICDAIYPSKILGHNNVPELREMLQADADIVRRADVFGPDTWQTVVREVDLPPIAMEAYQSLAREWLYYHEQGTVLADHTLKRLIRFQQLTAGYLRTEDGQDIPMHTAKIDAVIADLGEIVASGEKAVIWHKFTWEGEQYADAVSRAFPDVTVRRIYGGSSAGQRDEAVSLLRDRPSHVVLVCQTQAAGVGISLAEATHAMFVSQSFSFTDEEQARDRIYKPGESRCITYYRARNTVDEFVASVIDSKTAVHQSVTNADVREMIYGALRVH